MAEEVQYSSDVGFNKRKYEEDPTPPSTRRPTGFSGPISSTSPEGGQGPTSYNSVPPPDANDVFQSAKLKAQEIASRLLLNATLGTGGGAGATAAAGGYDAKRVRVDSGSSFDSSVRGGSPAMHSVPSAIPSYNFSQNASKKIDIPSGRVGVIIGKSGDTIKYLQLQSGAKIQVTRDMDADPNASTRAVDITGTPEQIARAEQLISDVLAEAEAGGSGIVSQRVNRQTGTEQFVMKVPNNKVGLVIGKGGETIKSMQATTGARIQVIPLRLPPGDTSTERNVHIDGTPEQVEAAKQLVIEVTSENRMRNSMGGGSYQARPQQSWGAAPQMQQAAGYGYGAYPGAQQYMSQPQYGGYPPQASANWDQTSQQGGGSYDYYNQQQQAPSQQQQQQTPSSQGDPSGGYNYPTQPTQASSYSQQGYGQDGYGGYHAPQSGYTQQQPHYDQQQQQQQQQQGGYVSTAEGGHAASNYVAQADSNQAPPPASQPGYDYSQSGYGNPPPTQSGYGVGYGQSPSKPPTTNPPPAAAGAYGQPQPPSLGYGAPSYGGPPAAAGGYGQQQPSAYAGYGGNGYSQPPPAYSSDGTGGGGAHTGSVPPSSSQSAAGGAPASPRKS